ncbi:MAG: hypothetical protein Q9191_001066 [Dirinaria sp. TL-2023a]
MSGSSNHGQQEEETMLILDRDNEPVRETLGQLMTVFAYVQIRRLAEEDRTCPCCRCRYMEIREGEDPLVELPVRTLCGHVLGEACLKRWLPNNTCPLCRAQLFSVPDDSASEDEDEEEDSDMDSEEENSPAQVRVQSYSPDARDIREVAQIYQSWPRSRAWLVAEIRRVGAFREARLYADLLADRATLPGPRTFGPDLHGLLDWRQDRALCHEIRRLGGFEYDGMGYDIWASNWQTVEEKYEELRNERLCWNLRHHAWIRHDGTVVYARDGSGTAQGGAARSRQVVALDLQSSEEDIQFWLNRLQSNLGPGEEIEISRHSVERRSESEDLLRHRQVRRPRPRPVYSHDSRENIQDQQEMSEAGGEATHQEHQEHQDQPDQVAEEGDMEIEEAEVVESVEADQGHEAPAPTVQSRNAHDYELDPDNSSLRWDWRAYLERREGSSEAEERRVVTERFNTLARSVGTWEI